MNNIVSISIIIVLLGLQIFAGPSSWVKEVKKSPPRFNSAYQEPGYLKNLGAREISGWFSKQQINSPKLMVTEAFGNFIYFLDPDQIPLTEFPLLNSKLLANQSNIDDPIAIWNYQGWSELNVRSRVISISEKQFIQEITTNQIKYVIISTRTIPLTFYLYNHPDFALTYGPDEFGNSIFEVSNKVFPLSHYPDVLYEKQIGRGTIKFLEKLKNQRNDDYILLKTEYFISNLGLTSQEFEDLQNKKYPLFDETMPLSHFQYIQRINNYYGESGIAYVINSHEEKLNWVTEQSATRELLTTMYLYTGDYEEAFQNIQVVIQTKPQDAYANNLLLLTDFAIKNHLTPSITIEIYDELINPSPYSMLDPESFEQYNN